MNEGDHVFSWLYVKGQMAASDSVLNPWRVSQPGPNSHPSLFYFQWLETAGTGVSPTSCCFTLDIRSFFLALGLLLALSLPWRSAGTSVYSLVVEGSLLPLVCATPADSLYPGCRTSPIYKTVHYG